MRFINAFILTLTIFLIITSVATLFVAIYYMDPTHEDIQFKVSENKTNYYNVSTYNITYYNQYESINSSWIQIENWNAFWFNDSRCNENNTESYYESNKIDGQWQMTEVLTCLNMTVRIIPQ